MCVFFLKRKLGEGGWLVFSPVGYFQTMMTFFVVVESLNFYLMFLVFSCVPCFEHDDFFGSRWELPEATHAVSASTANELRQDRHATHVNPEKLKAAAEGLANGTFHIVYIDLLVWLMLSFAHFCLL